MIKDERERLSRLYPRRYSQGRYEPGRCWSERLVASVLPGIVVLLLAIGATGCSPSLAPLYTDFEAIEEVVPNDSIIVRIERALAVAGWTQAESAAANVVATEERVFNKWGLYDVRISIELAPVTDHYVRVFINPYRVYFTGARSKMPFLKRGVRRAVLPNLVKALGAENIYPIGSAIERDRIAERK